MSLFWGSTKMKVHNRVTCILLRNGLVIPRIKIRPKVTNVTRFIYFFFVSYKSKDAPSNPPKHFKLKATICWHRDSTLTALLLVQPNRKTQCPFSYSSAAQKVWRRECYVAANQWFLKRPGHEEWKGEKILAANKQTAKFHRVKSVPTPVVIVLGQGWHIRRDSPSSIPRGPHQERGRGLCAMGILDSFISATTAKTTMVETLEMLPLDWQSGVFLRKISISIKFISASQPSSSGAAWHESSVDFTSWGVEMELKLNKKKLRTKNRGKSIA